MGDGRLTGLALMHVHQHIDEIVNDFATMHPRRMKLANIFEDCFLYNIIAKLHLNVSFKHGTYT